jgi:hypothetical protein
MDQVTVRAPSVKKRRLLKVVLTWRELSWFRSIFNLTWFKLSSKVLRHVRSTLSYPNQNYKKVTNSCSMMWPRDKREVLMKRATVVTWCDLQNMIINLLILSTTEPTFLISINSCWSKKRTLINFMKIFKIKQRVTKPRQIWEWPTVSKQLLRWGMEF